MNLTIKVHNVYSYIYGNLDEDVLEKVLTKLSYAVMGANFSPKYNTMIYTCADCSTQYSDAKADKKYDLKCPSCSSIETSDTRRMWDGRKKLGWNNKNCISLYTGLLSQVLLIFKSNKIQFDIVDLREKFKKELDLQFSTGITPRQYQEETINESIKRQRGIVKAATGAGKTLIASGIIQKLGLKDCIFLATSGDLILQTKDEFERFLTVSGIPLEVGVIGAGHCDIKDINVMTVQTACASLDVKYEESIEEEHSEKEKISPEIKAKKQEIKALMQRAKVVIFDEVQHAACDTVKEVMLNCPNAFYRYGMSVFSESTIEIKGGIFGYGQVLTIEEAWNSLSECYSYYLENGYEVINLEGYHSRGWEGDCFKWKPIKRFIRHLNNKKSYKIRFAGQGSVSMTEDHSLFRIQDDKIQECTPTSLKIGDVLLLDNGKNWSGNNLSNITIFDYFRNNYLKHRNVRFGLDISNCNSDDLGLTTKSFWQLKNRGKVAKKYGGSLSVGEYFKNKHKLPTPDFIYTEGASEVGVSSDLSLFDISYMIGYFIGDGWLDGNRISFAIQNDFVDSFISRIRHPKLKVNPKIKDTDYKCKIVSISCKPLSIFLRSVFGTVCSISKSIPDEFIFSSEEIRRELLAGLMDSDGSYSRTISDINKNRRTLRYTTISPLLKDGFCSLLRSLNVQYTISERAPHNGGRQIVGDNVSWQIIFSHNALDGLNDKHKGNTKTTDIDCLEKKVLEIASVESEGYVYDLEMSGHQSFVANGVLVHNSASPWRDDKRDLEISAFFSSKAYTPYEKQKIKNKKMKDVNCLESADGFIVDISASYLIRKGFLVKPYIYFYEIDTDFMRFFTYPKVYKNYIVDFERRNLIVKHMAHRLLDKGHTVLVLVKQKKHGVNLEKMIDDSVFISGAMSNKKRKKVLDDLRDDKIKTVIATSIFDEGIDVKRLSALILAGSGKSSTRALQRIGRVIRPFEEDGKKKTRAIIIDFLDTQKYLIDHSKERIDILKTEDEFEIIIRDESEVYNS